MVAIKHKFNGTKKPKCVTHRHPVERRDLFSALLNRSHPVTHRLSVTHRRPDTHRHPGECRDPFGALLNRSHPGTHHRPNTHRHPGECRDPFGALLNRIRHSLIPRTNNRNTAWIPAFAGMTLVRNFFITIRLLIAAILISAGSAVQAAEITVSVQPQNPVANESFQILFNSDSSVDEEPDFSVLEAIVDILGRNRQTSIQWINGRNSHTTTWALEVIVRTPGRLVIPEIAFGSDRSNSTIIEIHPRGGSTSAVVDTGLLLEIEVDNKTPYVQQQIILTARLLRRVELNDANLTDPSADADVIIKRLGKDSTTQTTRNNKRYEMFERRFAIFPQTSGPVTLNPLTLTTQIVHSTRSLFDPFRQTVKTRRIESNQIELQVKPIPPSFTGDTWLPAKRLGLRDDWDPDDDTLTAGEPLTRTVFLWADGLNSGQLPELPIPLPEGLKIYPDQPQTSEQETDTGFSAIRQQKFAIIPSMANKIVFPEVSVTWWNTETDRMEVAHLNERPFTVKESTVAEPEHSELADGAASSITSTANIDPVGAGIAELTGVNRNIWFILACVCLLGWIATILAWWLRSRARSPTVSVTNETPAPAFSRARRDVLGACKANDPAGTKTALIAWGRVAFDQPQLMTLGEVAELVAEPLDAEIRQLDGYLYGRNRTTWDQFALREAFEHGDYRAPVASEMKQTVNPLPDLYRLSGR